MFYNFYSQICPILFKYKNKYSYLLNAKLLCVKGHLKSLIPHTENVSLTISSFHTIFLFFLDVPLSSYLMHGM